MHLIKRMIEKPEISLEELMTCFERIKLKGDVVVIKFDGERDEDAYTVFVSFPKKNRIDSHRRE